MSHDFALVLISGHPDLPLTKSHFSALAGFIQSSFVWPEGIIWLCPEKAAEIHLPIALSPPQLAAIRQYLDPFQIDVFIVENHCRRKKLLLADMDATIVAGETLDDLAEQAGIKDKIAGITARAMRGELDFRAALTERVSMLAGLSAQALQQTKDHLIINQGAKDLIRVMRKNGATCYLVSGGFTYFTEYVAAKCGFDGHHGNTLEIQQDLLTGRVIPPILDKDSKQGFLEDYRNKLGLCPEETLAVGDGANDIPMLLQAGLGVGFHPKPLVREKVSNWVVHTDLTSLLYIQGYTWQDIA